jgi:hypothetical protein
MEVLCCARPSRPTGTADKLEVTATRVQGDDSMR